MTREEFNTIREVARDLINEQVFGDWEQSCKFSDDLSEKLMEKLTIDFD